MLPFIVSPIATLQAMGCPIIIGSPSNQRGPGQLLTVGSSLYFIVRAQMGTTPSDAILVYKSVNITTWNLVAKLPFSPGPNLDYIDRDAPAVVVGSTIYIADYLENATGSRPSQTW